MASAASLFQLPTQLKQRSRSSLTRKERSVRVKRSTFPVARLFGPVIFEASKLKVLHLGVEKEKHPGELPRIYTLTHCDITSNITLTVSHTINSAQLRGWYNKLQRDEVVAEWKMVRGKMSLHVHCHISGGHFLLDLVAHFRYYIFCKELPLVARLFGPAIFEASKLKVRFLRVEKEKHPGKLPRTYTLTHSNITSKITLAISHTINSAQLQGWYNKLQRDEVVAEWKMVQEKMSLHVHCHISGGHFLLDLLANL